ncbi:G patch domain-containing protein 11 [Gryllus bimaculatus]|nr:G patch domain-containing protein 11 [Gryllus bimaculatus]
MSSDEECDYMSEKFLTDCASQDIRPGLLFNRSQKRSHEMLKKQTRTNEENKKRFRPTKHVEEERRQEGLSQALDSSNKGFALLQKMGYKPGSAIGKTGGGRVDPIRIEVKADRHGLGREAALREVAIRKAHLRKQALQRREQLTSVDSYRSRLARQQAEKMMEADLFKSQKVCQQLDIEKNEEVPTEPWFWPAVKKDEEQGEEEAEDTSEDTADESETAIEFETQEKLEILTLYLRKAHLYCIWCGTKYDDDADLSQNCPGPTRDDH